VAFIKRQLPALTGIRFFLALWVIVYHQSGSDRPWFEQLDLAQPWMSVVRTGYAAVSIFFILSGFVLAYNYNLRAPWTPRERWRFGIARFSRIYPAYFLGLCAMAPLIAYRLTKEFSLPGAARDAWSGLLSFSLLQSWLPQTALTWNVPGWSLSNEAFFYACFPFVGIWIWRADTLRAFLTWVAALWVLSLFAPLWAVWLPVPGFGDITAQTPMVSSSPWAEVIRYNPLIRMVEFCAGILVGRIFFQIETRLAGRGYWFYLPGIAVSCLVASQAHRIPYPVMHNGLLLPVYACTILGLALSGGWVARWLSTGVLVFLGNVSYSMYILHLPLFAWLSILWVRLLHWEPSGLLWQATYIAVVVLISSLVYKGLEEPAHYWLKRKLNQWLEKRTNQTARAVLPLEDQACL